jgi:hypothetical protein
MNTKEHNNKLLTALLNNYAVNRANAIGAIVHAARNANSLDQLRAEIDRQVNIMMTVDALHDEEYRIKERVLPDANV